MCKERKEAWWNETCNEIEEFERKHKTKEVHAKVKEMSTKKRSKSGTNCIRDKNAKMLFDSNDVINRWVEHVAELYYYDERGDPPYTTNQNGCTIMKSEIENVIKAMKCGKAIGNDNIATTIIKALGDEGIKKITELCNLVYDTGYLPSDMSSSIFVTLPKKAKATESSDYRPLSLTSHLLKIPLKVILKRNKPKIESEINETQSGVMAEKGTREGTYNLRTIIERYVKCGKNIPVSLISWGEKKTNEEVLEMVDEQHYIIPTIKKRKITYFGHMFRRNKIHRLLLEGPLEGNVSRGRPIMEIYYVMPIETCSCSADFDVYLSRHNTT